jgi:AcrR family transcriptional regulator
MAAAGSSDRPSTSTLRRRIVTAASRLTTSSGWSSVTMARLADEAGVSRQTVYNEIGGKQALAQAMILDELGRFLAVVDAAFDAHPDDLPASIRTAAHDVLEFAQDNKLLHAIVSATHGADTDLLPLLTTHAGSLLSTAKAVVARRIEPYELALDEAQRDAAVDVVVRLVLSHVMQPSASPERTADDIAWLTDRVLRAG